MADITVRAPVILAIYVGGFAIGVVNHARDFLDRGWRPYHWAQPALELFWTSLILLDLLVITVLLAGWRRTALVLAAGIIAADVTINTFAWRVMGIGEFADAVLSQAAVLGLVIGSAPFLWRDPGRR